MTGKDDAQIAKDFCFSVTTGKRWIAMDPSQGDRCRPDIDSVSGNAGDEKPNHMLEQENGTLRQAVARSA